MGRGYSREVGRWLAVAVLAGGCAARAGSAPSDPVVQPPPAASSQTTAAGDLMGSSDVKRLAALARERSSGSDGGGYRIGPDDLLDIRVPDLLDAQPFQQGAQPDPNATGPASIAGSPAFREGTRVDHRGNVSLPLIGDVRAAGLTPAQLERDIAKRLVSAGILRRPQVSVQIAEYRSRVVAVVGSVERPGTYPLTRPGATVADMIWVAGGPGKDAGRIVLFSPAGSAEAPEARSDVEQSGDVEQDVRLAASTQTQSDADPTGMPPGASPIRIDLQALLRAGDVANPTLNPEVRPGDVISIAPAGSVLIEGWVEKPGSYPVTPGLTLSGAVAAAGGAVYAADLETVTVRRMLSPGDQRVIPVDLAAVSEGRQPDVPILDGDVVSVPMHSGKIVPYGLWKVGREVIHVGASVPIF